VENEVKAAEETSRQPRTPRAVPRVHVQTRHSTGCNSKRDTCSCPKRITWFADGKLHHQNANTCDLFEAEKAAHTKMAEFEAAAKGEPLPPKPEPPAKPAAAHTLEADIATFLKASASRKKVTEQTQRLRANHLKTFIDFCHARKLTATADVKPADCVAFSMSLEGHQNSRCKVVQTAQRFYKFCVNLDMVAKTPFTDECRIQKTGGGHKAKALNNEQLAQLLAAIPMMNGTTTDEQKRAVRSLVLLMRHSGLAIKDAACFERSRLTQQADGWWCISGERAKTGKTVTGEVHPSIAADILAGCNQSGRYLFTDEPLSTYNETTLRNYVSRWHNLCDKLSAVVELKDENDEPIRWTSHFCRHSFVLQCITDGLATGDIAALTGATEKTISEYYSTWLYARQQNLKSRQRAALAKQFGEVALSAVAGK
jgi:hypothetical protein